jgi:hypothetical protein
VRFYNKRGTAEQWIKEGKQAAHWTRLSCHRFRANDVRLQLNSPNRSEIARFRRGQETSRITTGGRGGGRSGRDPTRRPACIAGDGWAGAFVRVQAVVLSGSPRSSRKASSPCPGRFAGSALGKARTL